MSGAPSPPAQTATLAAINYFREMAGLPAVDFDASLSTKAQQAALIMYAQNDLSHDPPPTWACYTAAGDEGAGASNLFLGRAGASSIAGYMDDPGSNNYFAGHRRWILYPPQSSMGSGSTCCSNALYVFGAQTAPTAPPPWVPWPTPGFVPYQVEPEGRWSLSATDPTTDFSNARVSVTSQGMTLPVTVRPVVIGYGNPTLVWDWDPGYGTGRADRAYDVLVTDIVQNGLPVSHQYTVTLFDGEIDASQTISFPSLADRVYGDGFTATATATSGLPVNFTSATMSVCTTSGTNGATITPVGVGTCTIQADQPGDAIRNPALAVLRSFTVTKKQLVVQAVNVTRPSGAANPPLSVNYSGFASGQTLGTSGVTGTPSCTSTATAASPVGAYPISCDQGTLQSANYSFTMLPGTLTVAPRSGYWMLGSAGAVYGFGDAAAMGSAPQAPGQRATNIAVTPTGNGYLVVNSAGQVNSFGDARNLGGSPFLRTGEIVTSISTHPSGDGYWLFTSHGRVFPYGAARQLGDLAAVRLSGPVLGSVATPSGNGYYMVASDGGIFAFGDAAFRGSMGGQRLNGPVVGLAPDPDGIGYWLVGIDGGIFAFDSPFRGSMGSYRLNGPVIGMVAYGNGYLMVATDGGIFSFSSKPFAGSLGGRAIPAPIVAVAALNG